MSSSLWIAVMIAIALFAGLIVPYLIEEITRGKIEVGPRMPTGAGDTRPGYRGNPAPGRPIVRASGEGQATLSLRSFHIVLISLSIILAAGTGAWALFNNQATLGALGFGAAVLLIVYGSYFLKKAAKAHVV